MGTSVERLVKERLDKPSQKSKMTHMSYDPITRSHEAYLARLDEYDLAVEAYQQSDYYQEDLDESGMTEKEYDNSPGFDNAVESFIEDMRVPDYDW